MRFYMQSFYTKHMNTKHASTHSADQPVPPKRNSPLFNQSLEKGLAVIRAFSTAHRSMTMGDVAEAIHISRSSAQRMVFTLEQLGYMKDRKRVGAGKSLSVRVALGGHLMNKKK